MARHSTGGEALKIKESLYNHCLDEVRLRISRIQGEIKKIQISANQETKSSAGDKFETGRAMAQQEVELNMRQLGEAEKLETSLLAIPSSPPKGIVSPGSLVTTSGGVFFIAVSIGTVTLGGCQYMVISPESPIGKILLGKKVEDQIHWGDRTYIIQSIA